VWGTTFAVFVGTVYFIYVFHHQTGYPLWETFQRAYLKPLLCSLAVAGVLLVIGGQRPAGWLVMGLKGGSFGTLYLVSVALSRFFDEFDLAKAESVFPAARFARRIIPVA
jgi:hypothetical protein